MDILQPGHLSLDADWFWTPWSPDGTKLLGHKQVTAGRIAELSVAGSGQIQQLGEITGILNDVSPDGKEGLFFIADGSIGSARLDGSAMGTTPRTLVQSSGGEVDSPGFSPDGHWIVYSVVQQGIFVQPYPGPGLRKQLTGSGSNPIWRGDGREILYRLADGIWSVMVQSAPDGLQFSPPKKLFSGVRVPADATSASKPLAVSRDGSRIYFPQAAEQPTSDAIQIRMGWFNAEAKGR